MRQYLTKNALEGVLSSIKKGTKIDRNLADNISSGLKEWAISKGVQLTIRTGFNL